MKEYPINAIDNEYIEWLKAIKQQIRSSKIRMIKTVNTELIHFLLAVGTNDLSKAERTELG